MKDTKIVIAISRSDALAMTRDIALGKVRVYLDTSPFNKATADDSFTYGQYFGGSAQANSGELTRPPIKIQVKSKTETKK